MKIVRKNVEDDVDDDSLESALHSHIQFRLTSMITNPSAYGETREAIILQLMLIAEFASLANGTGDTEISFRELVSCFPDALVEPQRAPELAWIRECVAATGVYIGRKADEAHEATCQHCGPSGRMVN
jgi:hypothetical protein